MWRLDEQFDKIRGYIYYSWAKYNENYLLIWSKTTVCLINLRLSSVVFKHTLTDYTKIKSATYLYEE